MKKRPITTLFMLESLDGKISSGSTDELDADKDWCKMDGFQVHITASDWSIEETRKLNKELADVLVSLGLYEESSGMLTEYGHKWNRLNQLQEYSIQYTQNKDGNTCLSYDTQIEAGYSEYCIGYGFRFEYLIHNHGYLLNDVLFMDYRKE